MPEMPGRVRIPALQTHGIWESAIGYDPDTPSTNYSDPNPASAIDNAIWSWNDFVALARLTSTSSVDDICSACHNLKDYSHDSDDSPPTSLEDALCKMEETLRKSKETLRKLKEKFNFKDVDSESDSSKSKSKVPVQTESSSRASPNRNPLHEENENNDFHTDHENDGVCWAKFIIFEDN